MQYRFCITIRGKVQGVYFRASTKQIADILGLTGFVQNLPDGHVYAEAQGDHELLVRFIQWCHHGPENAQVISVSVTETECKPEFSFEILR